MRLVFTALITYLLINSCAARKSADGSSLLAGDEAPIRGDTLFTCLSADKNDPSLKLVYTQDPVFRTNHLYSFKDDGSGMKAVKLGPWVQFGNEISMSRTKVSDKLNIYGGGGAGLDAKLVVDKTVTPNGVFQTYGLDKNRVKGPGYNLKMKCDPASED